MNVVNLTISMATPEEIDHGVVEPTTSEKKQLQQLLKFKGVPTEEAMIEKAQAIAEIAVIVLGREVEEDSGAMIWGAPFFTRYIEDALLEVNIRPGYSYVVKSGASFKHECFIWA